MKKTSINTAVITKCNLNSKFENISKSVSPKHKFNIRNQQNSQRIPLQSTSIKENELQGHNKFSHSFASSRMLEKSEVLPYKNLRADEIEEPHGSQTMEDKKDSIIIDQS